ncbi:MAG TPA: hypothetical protein VK194_06995, partial [Candidatus Deferrimicrobium sp.]|nr:hypothetical protein [Candidatus Deferrimicrobium sp.]
MALPRPVVVGSPGRGRAGRPGPGPEPAHDHAHAHEALAPHGGRYDSILDAIGHTPLVEIPR